MYKRLAEYLKKPEVFSVYTVDSLWTKPHIADNMLNLHLNAQIASASRSHDFIDKSVEFIDRYFDIGNKQIIDFGCGPGLYTCRFSKKGADVAGVDFSANSIKYAREYAKEQKLDIKYIQEDYLAFSTEEKYDLATLIYCDYCAIGDNRRKKLLDVVYKSLKDDGHFFFDVHTYAMFDGLSENSAILSREEGGFFSQVPYVEINSSYLYKAEKVSLSRYTIIEEGETWEIYNWLKYFSKETIAEELEKSGFEVVEYFGDAAGNSYDEKNDVMAIIARKKNK